MSWRRFPGHGTMLYRVWSSYLNQHTKRVVDYLEEKWSVGIIKRLEYKLSADSKRGRISCFRIVVPLTVWEGIIVPGLSGLVRLNSYTFHHNRPIAQLPDWSMASFSIYLR